MEQDKYNLFRQQVKDSFVADCAMAVLKALENCISKEKFIEKMKQFGWNVNWTEKRKHITFQNRMGRSARQQFVKNIPSGHQQGGIGE